MRELLFLLSCGLIACSSNKSARPEHWGYSGKIGPANWAELSPVYAVCSAGDQQSPVDIPLGSANGTKNIQRSYGTTRLAISHHEHVEEIINNGHTIQVTCDPGSTIEIDGVTYTLKQFHFHTPSEHRVGGMAFPMEVHFVHQSEDGRFAVLAVLCSSDSTAKTHYDEMIHHLPSKPGERLVLKDVIIDLDELLPTSASVYHYVGSFTTPPCTENVQWLVMREPRPTHPLAINAIHQRIHDNNRPVQAINGRLPTVVQPR
ncbi:MAG TPA: carbonic anhydrase family protein [Candidatus Didemnitutus sp.]|nr:carbonic anhydrase family protein [Candidatus Didemnitutus sp.]